MILSLALRNIRRNLKQSVVIFLLFALLIALFFIGNALIAESGEGLKASYRRNFTGDLVVKAPTTMEVSLFGAVTPSMGEYYLMPYLEDKERIRTILGGSLEVEDYAEISSGAAVAEFEGKRFALPLFGVEGEGYFELFPGLKILDGDIIRAGQPGVMLSSEEIYRMERETGVVPEIGDHILLNMAGRRGVKIREVPLTGVFAYDTRDPQLDRIALCDLGTLNALNAASASVVYADIENDEISLMDGDLDDLFSEDLGRIDGNLDPVSVSDVVGILEQKEIPGYRSEEAHFMLIRLRDGVDIGAFRKELEKDLLKEGLDARIMDWKDAAGLSARMVFLLQILYNAGFILVVLAGGVAIVNILLIAVFDRFAEIGTLRAIGAAKVWVALLVLVENLILALTGGIIGLILGFLTVQGINGIHLNITNVLMQTLLGMRELHIGFHPGWALVSVAVSLVLGLLASWIPIRRAVAVLPTEALRRSGR